MIRIRFGEKPYHQTDILKFRVLKPDEGKI